MTPAQIFGLVKDTLIVVAVAAILWFVWDAKGNKDAVAGLKADVAAVKQNADQQSKWQEGINSALNTSNQQYQQLGGVILANSKPIIVRVPTGGAVQAPTAGSSPQSGNATGVSRGQQPPVQSIDIRPVWNAYLTKYGGALIDGQACYASWPK